ncbi:DUF4292 domain-containing protein [Rhizosphaericola mali]|uniref:DUF4292 domain-containing protein n=1 Tax=Rhizosphaericola mali TaxID=2545455 RepID=A0A5P2G6P4_9BACT|nr:DUF4292 domain-containing protein [Rhizosphaericola mali]QES87181.1 DUF4292 domain-containing protein [Rhizosphaericola mali]
MKRLNWNKWVAIGMLPVMILSCRSTKKIQQTGQNTTSQSITKDSNKIEKPIFDSMQWAKTVLDSSIGNELKYHTFSSKMSFSINSIAITQSGNASLRMANDSLIWMMLSGPFGIEGGRAKISSDSIIIMDKIHGNVMPRSIDFLQNLAQAPIDLPNMQSLLLGKYFFPTSDFKGFLLLPNKNLQLSFQNGKFYAYHELNNNGSIVKTLLTDTTRPDYQCLVEYDTYENTSNGNFPKNVTITVTGKMKMKVELKTKDYKLNENQDYPFNIPSKYSVK